MKSITRCLAILVFAITAVAGIAAQRVRDTERAENERDLALRSWNLRILQIQHDKAKNQKPLPRQALASVLDAQETSKARRDPEEIIQLSKRVKKGSDRLRKN